MSSLAYLKRITLLKVGELGVLEDNEVEVLLEYRYFFLRYKVLRVWAIVKWTKYTFAGAEIYSYIVIFLEDIFGITFKFLTNTVIPLHTNL